MKRTNWTPVSNRLFSDAINEVLFVLKSEPADRVWQLEDVINVTDGDRDLAEDALAHLTSTGWLEMRPGRLYHFRKYYRLTAQGARARAWPIAVGGYGGVMRALDPVQRQRDRGDKD